MSFAAKIPSHPPLQKGDSLVYLPSLFALTRTCPLKGEGFCRSLHRRVGEDLYSFATV